MKALIIRGTDAFGVAAPLVHNGHVHQRLAEWRGFKTDHRGELAIFASQAPADDLRVEAMSRFTGVPLALCQDYHAAMHQKYSYRLLGIVELVGCVDQSAAPGPVRHAMARMRWSDAAPDVGYAWTFKANAWRWSDKHPRFDEVCVGCRRLKGTELANHRKSSHIRLLEVEL